MTSCGCVECGWKKKYETVAVALRRCAIELVYIHAVENCNSGLCATGEGAAAISQAQEVLGPMREWPEIKKQKDEDAAFLARVEQRG